MITITALLHVTLESAAIQAGVSRAARPDMPAALWCVSAIL